MCSELLNASKKFKNLREVMENSTPPCIPHIGLVLKF